MEQREQKVIRTPLRQRMADFRRGPLTAVVWLACLALVAQLLGTRSQTPQFIGIARALQYELASTTAGSIESLHAGLYQDVEQGDVLVLLDSKNVEARIATIGADVERLSAELDAERTRLDALAAQEEEDATAELRRFRNDEDDMLLRVLRLRVQLEGDRIERDRIALLRDRSKRLFEQDIGPEAVYDDFRLQHERLVQTIAENEVLLARTETAHEATRERRLEFEREYAPTGYDSALLVPLARAIEVTRGRLEELELERRGLALRAPADGRVSAILKRPGEVVLAGQPVLTLADARAGDILVYLPEIDGSALEEGTAVLVSQSLPRREADTVVTSVSPTMEELPMRLWRDPRFPEWGRPVLVARPGALDLVPGERVGVHLR